MKLYIASDHAGFEYKERLKSEFRQLASESIEWIDLGAQSADATDYPANAADLCRRLSVEIPESERLDPRGVIICGSGIGVSIAANRFPGIRAVLAYEPRIAEMGRKHNAANVICFGQRVMSYEQMGETLAAFLRTPFEGKGVERHERRVRMMDSLP